MSVIVRYILRDLGVTFLFGFAVFTCLLLVGVVVEKAISNHVPLILVGGLVPFAFAEVSAISLPVALLLAVTTFFARMSGNNEVIALKALGIPPKAFLAPVFAVAILMSVIGVGINEASVAWGRPGISALIYSLTDVILIGQLEEKHRFDTPGNQITILVKGVDEQRRLIKPTIMLKQESVTMEAEMAQIAIDFDTNIFTLTLTNYQVIRESGKFGLGGWYLELPLPLGEIIPSGDPNRPANMALRRISEEKKQVAEQIEHHQRIIAAHRVFAASMGSVDEWTTWQINDAKMHISRLQSHHNRLSVEPQRRWATGFCCFFFVWLGAPLAIWMRKTDFFSSFFACFLPILLLYYPLLMLGVEQAKRGSVPPVSVWLANIAIGLIGLWFLRKIHRY